MQSAIVILAAFAIVSGLAATVALGIFKGYYPLKPHTRLGERCQTDATSEVTGGLVRTVPLDTKNRCPPPVLSPRVFERSPGVLFADCSSAARGLDVSRSETRGTNDRGI